MIESRGRKKGAKRERSLPWHRWEALAQSSALFSPEDFFFFLSAPDNGSQQVEVEEEAPWSVTPGDFFQQNSHIWLVAGKNSLLVCFGSSKDQEFFKIFFGLVECGAGNMSSGRLSHLLRGVWLLFLWQGEQSRERRYCVNVHLAIHRKSEGFFFFSSS